jgi:hypothetical protein
MTWLYVCAWFAAPLVVLWLCERRPGRRGR